MHPIMQGMDYEAWDGGASSKFIYCNVHGRTTGRQVKFTSVDVCCEYLWY